MSSSKRILCKYFAHGACFKGEHCEFAHDWSAPANNICTFYQKGICSYGSRCRYEHVKPSRLEFHTPSSSTIHHQDVTFDHDSQASSSSPALTQQHLGFIYDPDALSSTTALSGVNPVTSPMDSYGVSAAPQKTGWNVNFDHHGYVEDVEPLEPRIGNHADRSICSYAAVGNCPRGENCPHIHGDLCPTCGKHCLHPFRPQEREEHIKTCEKKQNQLAALKLSQEIECSVCLETVLSKPTPVERKFGILSECDHPFCITCIRNWRSSMPTPGVDVNGALRACPICRKLSYFVIPSVIWYSTKEEKQELIDNYKTKLKSIDCKHFNFGNGNCPFGTSCFYKHAYRDGRLEEVVLRHLSAEDGQMVIAKNIRLSDFLEGMHIS